MMDQNVLVNTLMNELTVAFDALRNAGFDFATADGVVIMHALGRAAECMVGQLGKPQVGR